MTSGTGTTNGVVAGSEVGELVGSADGIAVATVSTS